jgi:hypothetical protein
MPSQSSCTAQRIELAAALLEQSPIELIQGALIGAITVAIVALQLALKELKLGGIIVVRPRFRGIRVGFAHA